MHKEKLSMKEYMPNPIAHSSSNNIYNLYYHQYMKAPDSREFQKVITKEVNDHIKKMGTNRNRTSAKIGTITPICMGVKRKRDVKTKGVFKHKACLNVHGRKKEYFSNFFKMFSPVMTWFTISMVIVLSIIN